MAALGVVAVVSTVALRRVLPPLSTPPDAPAEPGGRTARTTVRSQLAGVPAALRSGPLLAVCFVTVAAATGQFAAYTYITALVRRDAGLTGLALSAVLFGYGAAGIAGIALAARITDRRPRLATGASLAAMALALGLLASLAHGSAVGTVASVALWGAGFTALPVVLQAAVLRVAPRSADTASALYVVAFQIGIGGGALAGSLLVNAGLLAVLPVAALALAVIGLLIVLAARRAFPPRGPAQPGPPSPADDLSPERPRQVRS
jgi:predicted MFS family arabinose efflux permease